MRHAQNADGRLTFRGAYGRDPVSGDAAASLYRPRQRCAGDGAAASLIDRAKALGIEAIILSPTLEDFNEDLRGLGVDALRTAIRAQIAPRDVARFMELPA